MKHPTIVPLLLAAAALAPGARAHDVVPAPPQERPVLLRGGDLYTVSHGVLAATDLLFADGRIVEIGPDLAPPAGAEIVDVRGKRVYPGLIAPFTPLGLIEIEAARATDDRTEVGSVTPEAAAIEAFNPDSELIPTVRSHGITTAQIVPGGSLVRGRSFLVHLDGWTREDAALAPVDGLILGWPPSRIGRRGRDDDPEEQQKRMAELRRELRDAFDRARAYLEARAADPSIEPDVRWEAMVPALAGEQPVYVAADDYRQIQEAVGFAREQGLRLVLVGGADAWMLTDLLKAEDVPVIVGSVTGLPERDDEDYDQAYELPRLLYEAGVRFCIAHVGSGWDVRNLPLQAGQAIGAGLPADAALRAVTLSTAEILGIDGREGSLDPGKDATLFVSDGDVLDVLGQRVTDLWIEGRRIELDDRQRELYRKYREKQRLAPAR